MENSEFIELLKNRYSCRSYLPQEVSDENIDSILYAGTLAPSTNNRQPWRFGVIKNKEMKNTISKMLYKKGIDDENLAFLKTAQAIDEAPVLLCVFNKEIQDESISIIQSIGACIQNITLSATELGLATLWIRATSCIEKEIEEMLDKKDEHLMACVTLGYANEEVHKKNRSKVKEITKYYK